MKPKALADSSFLYAIYNPKQRHEQAVKVSRELSVIIPQVTLVEVTYLLTVRINLKAAIAFLDTIGQSPSSTLPLADEDIRRAKEIMQQYSEAKFDFVDCCLMALSERLNITKVLTFDRRDFSIFRPKHCDYLELLP